MSGTGNSYRVAVWLQEACTAKDIDSEIIPIDIANPKEEIEASPENLIVLTYPTHGLLPPWSAVKFIFKMPFKRKAHIFSMPTRGCLRFGPIIIPGIAALASLLPVIFLPFKGYNIRGSLSFDMPSNLVFLHNRLSDKNIDRIKTSAKRKADKYFPKLLNGKPVWLTWNNLWEYSWTVFMLVFHTLFPIAYLLLGRFFMGQMLFANNNCIGCEFCAKSCPNSAITMKGKKTPRPYWRYNCEACLRCLNYCPQKAIEAGLSWAVILYFIWIWGYPILYFMFNFFGFQLPIINSTMNYYWKWIAMAIYLYPAYIIAYFIFFNLIRIRLINYLFSYTALTHFYRRFHDPETALKDLLHKKYSDVRTNT
jgi:Pyruvate/2-oxoacid:ferredoxin oxidoreductase delta subunit